MIKRVFAFLTAIVLLLMLPACAFLRLPASTATVSPGATAPLSPTPQPQPTLTPLPEAAAGYAFHQLTETEQKLYGLLYNGAVTWAESVVVPQELGLTPNEGYRVMDCMLADHPEIFWLGEGYRAKKTAGDPGILVEFIYTYALDRQTADAWQGAIDAAVGRFLAMVENISNDYERALAAHSWLTENATYAKDIADRYMESTEFTPEESSELAIYTSIYGPLVRQTGICSGFAHAYQYLCGKMGFECTYISVEADGVGHAVNLLQLEGQSAFVDVTYDVANPEDRWMDGSPIRKIEHFGLNDELFDRLYTLRSPIAPPQCPGLALHAISRQYGYFAGEYEDIKQSMGRRLREGLRGDVTQVTFQFQNRELFNTVIERFINAREVFTLMDSEAQEMGLRYEGELRAAYSLQDPLCIIKFYFGDITSGVQ